VWVTFHSTASGSVAVQLPCYFRCGVRAAHRSALPCPLASGLPMRRLTPLRRVPVRLLRHATAAGQFQLFLAADAAPRAARAAPCTADAASCTAVTLQMQRHALPVQRHALPTQRHALPLRCQCSATRCPCSAMHCRRSVMRCRYSASPPKEISVQSRVQVRSPPDIRLAAPPRRCARLGWLRHLAGALAFPATGWLRHLVQLLRRCGRVSRCRHIAPQLSMQRWSLPDQFHSLLSQRSVLSVQLLSPESYLGSIEGAGARALRLRLAAAPRRCACLGWLRHLVGAPAFPAPGWLRLPVQLSRGCSRTSCCTSSLPSSDFSQKSRKSGCTRALLLLQVVSAMQLCSCSRGCSRVSRSWHIAPQLAMLRWSLPGQCHSFL